MQKKIIALAVAAVASSAAFAQSNVTVYGVADVYAAAGGSAGTKVSAIGSGGLAGSRIGFKGVEDLGNGTKALFTLEYSLAMDAADANIANGTSSDASKTQNASGIGFARQQFVGLTGNMGTVIAGRLQTLAYNHNAAFNPSFGMVVDTQAGAVAGVNTVAASAVNAASNLAIATAERLDNAVAYVAPTFVQGLTVAGAYTANASNGLLGTKDTGAFTATAVRAAEVSAAYTVGALSVGGVYRKVNDSSPAVGSDLSTALGASYDFGVAKLTANVARSSAKDAATYNLTTFGAIVPVSAKGAVVASYTTAKNNADADKKATAYMVAYKHNLSARTSLYAGLGQGTANENTKPVFAGVQGGTDGKVAAALAGINHSF